MKFELEKIQLDLKVNWKLSRNETLQKQNYIFKIIDHDKEFLGEIAPNIRYGETAEKIENDFLTFQKFFQSEEQLYDFLYQEDFSHSFQFAVESAFTHKKAAHAKKSVANYLGLTPVNNIDTSYSVPIMEEDLLVNYLKDLKRFKYIKIKVNQENAISFVKSVASKTNALLRVDGNEAWSDLDSYKKFEEAIKDCNIQFIEQPFAASNIDSYIGLKQNSLFEIMADESIEQNPDFDMLEKQFHSINVKLMKAGGYTKAIHLLTEAKARGMKAMIGCMIETSLGISSAMNIASLANYYDLDGSLLIKNDPFDLIEENNGSLTLK